MIVTAVYLNLFQFYYYLVKNTKTLTRMLMSGALCNGTANKILVMAHFHKITKDMSLLVKLRPLHPGYKIYQSVIDRYTYLTFDADIGVLDFDSETATVADMKRSLDIHPFTYIIVKSTGGYHVFITSRYIDYRRENDLRIMASFEGSDTLFQFFNYMNKAVSIRLCRKERENPAEPVYTILGAYVSKLAREMNVKPIPKIVNAVVDHIDESRRFSDIIVKDKENSRTSVLERRFTELENVPGSLLDPQRLYAKIRVDVPDDKFTSKEAVTAFLEEQKRPKLDKNYSLLYFE